MKRQQTDEAVAFYSKAVSFGDRREVVPALLYLGTRAFDTSEIGAQKDCSSGRSPWRATAPNANRALTWLAVLRQKHSRGRARSRVALSESLGSGARTPLTR